MNLLFVKNQTRQIIESFVLQHSTNSKPFKSENGILLWHIQYDDDDSEDFNEEEVMEAINLYKSRLIT